MPELKDAFYYSDGQTPESSNQIVHQMFSGADSCKHREQHLRNAVIFLQSYPLWKELGEFATQTANVRLPYFTVIEINVTEQSWIVDRPNC